VLECVAYSFDSMCQGKIPAAAVGLAMSIWAPVAAGGLFGTLTGLPWLLAERNGKR
jgi:hypothetical protein